MVPIFQQPHRTSHRGCLLHCLCRRPRSTLSKSLPRTKTNATRHPWTYTTPGPWLSSSYESSHLACLHARSGNPYGVVPCDLLACNSSKVHGKTISIHGSNPRRVRTISRALCPPAADEIPEYLVVELLTSQHLVWSLPSLICFTPDQLNLSSLRRVHNSRRHATPPNGKSQSVF